MFKLGKQFFAQNCTLIRRLESNALCASIFNRTYSSSYEGDGKTKAKVLNNDPEMGLMVNSFSAVGFRLNNKFNVIGPMVIFPRTVLSWNVDSVDDIDEHSLRLLLALKPKLELLIIGSGDVEVTPDLNKRLVEILKPYGIRVEVLKTEAAVTTFNFMNAESRFIAADLRAAVFPLAFFFGEVDRPLHGLFFELLASALMISIYVQFFEHFYELLCVHLCVQFFVLSYELIYHSFSICVTS